MFRKQKLDDLSVEELEQALRVKRRQERLKRFQRLSKEGRSKNEALVEQDLPPPPSPSSSSQAWWKRFRWPLTLRFLFKKGQKKAQKREAIERTRPQKILDTVLLILEVTAVAGLIGVLIASYFNLRELNDEVSAAQQNILQTTPAPTATPPIGLKLLPGGHSPPTSPGGAVPDVPAHLQSWVQPRQNITSSLGPIQVEASENPPTRIIIPKIDVDAPIVSGVSWENLKKGVGHLPGSANPGERGNLYLAAHNDIYGEIFRYLNKLDRGDEYFIYAGEEQFKYIVKEKRIIEPTEVEVMLPTTEPVATLQTCYPYLVDTHRLVVIGELVE